MRIIAGTFRSRKLAAPRGTVTRPSTDRVRESMFNLITSRMDLSGVHVLDLFAGSGALGLEALSRGAESVVFVDDDLQAIRTINANARLLGVADSCSIHRLDARAFLHTGDRRRFDLILADPPYSWQDMAELAHLALERLEDDGLFVLEHESTWDPDTLSERLECERRYGRTVVTIFS